MTDPNKTACLSDSCEMRYLWKNRGTHRQRATGGVINQVPGPRFRFFDSRVCGRNHERHLRLAHAAKDSFDASPNSIIRTIAHESGTTKVES